jgi:HSP20 family protein
MEDEAMTLLKRYESKYPSFPSIFDNWLSRDMMDWMNRNFSDTNTTVPAVNVSENENDFQIEVAAPGMTKDDFKITLENDTLTISSEKKEEHNEKKDGQYTRKEFSYQSFSRSFTIPERIVDGDRISAKYNNGLLHITLPKKEEAKPKPSRIIDIF